MTASEHNAETLGHNDEGKLLDLNERFINACRSGSWPALQEVLSEHFRYVDGGTGEMWDMKRYVDDHERYPNPNLKIADVVVHVAGDTAGVSARTSSGSRYLDVYARESTGWKCVQACVWRSS